MRKRKEEKGGRVREDVDVDMCVLMGVEEEGRNEMS